MSNKGTFNRISLSQPTYRLATDKLIGAIKVGLEKHDALLGQIKSYSVSHGGVTRQVSAPEVLDTPMQLFETTFVISKEAFLQTNAEVFTESFIDFFEALFSQQKRHLFAILSQTTEAVGNSIDAHGRNVWDAYLEAIEKVEMRFDETGNHNLQICLNPNTSKKLAENPPTPEQEKKIEQAIKAKRDTYYAQKRSRRLS